MSEINDPFSPQEHNDLPPLSAMVVMAPTAAPDLVGAPVAQYAGDAAQTTSTAELPADRVCTEPSVEPIAPPAPMPMPTPSEAAHPAPPFPMSPGGPVQPAPHRHVRANGKANPYRPETPEQIASFAHMWHDPAYTLAMMSRRYGGCHPRTIQKWATAFDFPPRDGGQGAPKPDAVGNTMNAAHGAEAVTRAKAQAAEAPATQARPESGDDRWNPLADPEIKSAVDEIKRETLPLSSHSDIQGLQRKLLRLNLLVATKTPMRSWESLKITAEGLTRLLLNTRRIEAGIPRGDVDQVQLRKDAASAMMHELKSVLSPEEQEVLARVMIAGAERLMKRPKSQEMPPTDLPGTQPAQHNGKLQPRTGPSS